MKDFLNQNLGKFLDDLASSSVTPGGGSAAALTATSGMALLEMTARLNADREKKKTGHLSAQAKDRINGLKKTRLKVSKLITQDAVCFHRLSGYLNNKQRGASYQKTLLACVNVPMEICGLSLKALQLALPEKDRTSRWLISDLTEGALLIKTAFQSARLNVEINLKSIGEKNFLRKTNRDLNTWQQKIEELTKEITVSPHD